MIGVFGYRWIHRVMQATAVIVGVTVVVMLAQGLQHALPASETTLARPPAGLFAAGVALLVIDMLSFGPFTATTADTCRRNQRPAAVLGQLLREHVSTVASCAAGAYLTALLPKLTPVAAIGQISGKWALIIMAFSLLNANTFNAYTGAFRSWLSAACGAGLRPSRSSSG